MALKRFRAICNYHRRAINLTLCLYKVETISDLGPVLTVFEALRGDMSSISLYACRYGIAGKQERLISRWTREMSVVSLALVTLHSNTYCSCTKSTNRFEDVISNI
jgi:hypothetical protein